MNSHEELKDAVKAALENRGVLRDVRARLRAEVFRSLDDTTTERPPLSNANLLVNSLINEYLEFNEYRHTESVLLAESGQSDAACLTRQFLSSELGLQPVGNAKKLPLLYCMVNYFLEKRHFPAAGGNQPPVSAADLEEDDDFGDERSTRFESDSARTPRTSGRADDSNVESGSARRRGAAPRRRDEDTRSKHAASKTPRTESESLSDRRASWKQEGDAIYIIQDQE